MRKQGDRWAKPVDVLNSPSQFEADRMGIILAYRTGYGTYGLPDVVQTIGQTNKSDSSVALLFKTHPLPDERLTNWAMASATSWIMRKLKKALKIGCISLKQEALAQYVPYYVI